MEKKKNYSLKKALFNRLYIWVSLMILQLVIMVGIITVLTEHAIYIYSFFQLLGILSVLWIVKSNDNPAYKMPWMILILSFPPFGTLFYLFWGNTPFNTARMVSIRPIASRRIGHIFEDVMDDIEENFPNRVNMARYITNVGEMPPCKNTKSQYFPLGEDKFQKLLEDLRSAKEFIFMEYFIIEEGEMWNSILDVLVMKVNEGLDVRLLYDDAGCITLLPAEYDKYLNTLGIQTVVFNPFKPIINSYVNYRDHRKISVIDGNIGYMGGINFADEYINKKVVHGHWKDTAVRLEGDSVCTLTLLFMQIWEFSTKTYQLEFDKFLPTSKAETDGFVQAFGDNPLDEYAVGETVYMQIINTAKKYVYITSPYLILDNEMVSALCTAAKSGVDVRIITPEHGDRWFVHAVTRSFYKQLYNSGVKLYEYTPGFIHSKMIVSDDDVCVVGTINMDFRSFYMHFECGTIFYGGTMVGKVKSDIEDTINKSSIVSENFFKKIGPFKSIVVSMLRVLSPIM